jgi:putative ABC transport system permease protein
MKYRRFVREIELGIKNLILHRTRSLLTMLGMVFGVGSVIAMLAVGEGASKEALEQIRLLGSNNVILSTVKPPEDSSQSRGRTLMSIYGLLYADEARIAETFAAVERTVPVRLLRKEGRLGGQAMELRVVGTTPAWFDLVRRPVLAGRPLLPQDLEQQANVAVLTDAAARRLLGGSHTLGQAVRIGDSYFQVVGIVESLTGRSGGVQTPDQANDAYIPLTTARAYFGDIIVERTAGASRRELVELHEILVQVRTVAEVEDTAAGIGAMLARFHPQEDYELRVPLALLRQAEATKRTFNIVLGSIAAISLLVGGIGIMNIMLASVTERTREIGIRRAIGAKRRQIITQFLVETVVLSTSGGLIGIGVGFFLPWLVTLVAGMPTQITALSMVLSLGISMGVGVVFGLYPAVRAARLDPIQALRHE